MFVLLVMFSIIPCTAFIQTLHQEVTLPCCIRTDSVNELFGG